MERHFLRLAVKRQHGHFAVDHLRTALLRRLTDNHMRAMLRWHKSLSRKSGARITPKGGGNSHSNVGRHLLELDSRRACPTLKPLSYLNIRVHFVASNGDGTMSVCRACLHSGFNFLPWRT